MTPVSLRFVFIKGWEEIDTNFGCVSCITGNPSFVLNIFNWATTKLSRTLLTLCEGYPLDSAHEVPVMQKSFLCHDIIMPTAWLIPRDMEAISTFIIKIQGPHRQACQKFNNCLYISLLYRWWIIADDNCLNTMNIAILIKPKQSKNDKLWNYFRQFSIIVSGTGYELWYHDDVIIWKHFPRYWPFVQGIHRSPVNSPHKGQWRGALMLSLICVWINGWVNNGGAGD